MERPLADYTIYVNGTFIPATGSHISALDRGFALGDGAFETMRVENGRVFRLGAHLHRLREGLRKLDITPQHDDAALEAIVGELLTKNGLSRASVRLTVSRGIPEARGLLPGRTLGGPTLVVQAMPFAGYPDEKYATGFKAVVATIRRNETSPTAYIKTCNYLDNILVRMEAAAAGADEGLMLNLTGNVACGSVSNVFTVKGNRLHTPPVSAGILAGITRGVVMEMAARERLPVIQADLSLAELRASDEAFVTNSLMGVMPLTDLGGGPIGDGEPGPIARVLQQRYLAMVEEETR